jgi:hypothetical protein
MYDLDAIAAINIEQLVTVTDRLLVGGLRKRRPFARASEPVVLAADEKTLYVRGAQPIRPAALGLAAVAGATAGVFIIAVFRLLA